jgi:phosphotransferase system  glucose/maltose/N-acetylglucosamine-specific IIC component
MKFDYKLEANPSFIPKILFPVWALFWIVGLIVYTAYFVLVCFFKLVFWLLRPRKKKQEKKEIEKEAPKGKTRK